MLKKENYIEDLFKFIKESPSVYHNIEMLKDIYRNNDFNELKENVKWNLNNNNKFYIVRNDCSIIAVKVGKNPKGFNIICSHNDSPSFKIKPTFETRTLGYVRSKVETYGGPIYFTWFDRPLSLAGRVMVKTKDGVVTRLVDLKEHTFIVPSVAPHVGNIDVQKPSVQNELLPVVGLGYASLLDCITEKVCLEESDRILSHDLFLYNKEVPTLVGLNNEMIASAKLDDLECACSSVISFLEADDNDDMINVCVVFNNEEIGSGSNNAAASTFLTDVLERICLSLNLDKYIMYANSMLVSADNAHAVHPSRPASTDIENPVYLNDGIVVKTSASLSYTSDAVSMAKFENVLIDNDIPYQVFANNSDVRGGGTLGRILLMHLSICSVDIGLGQLGMHSCFETAGSDDFNYMVKGLKAWYEYNK